MNMRPVCIENFLIGDRRLLAVDVDIHGETGGDDLIDAGLGRERLDENRDIRRRPGIGNKRALARSSRTDRLVWGPFFSSLS